MKLEGTQLRQANLSFGKVNSVMPNDVIRIHLIVNTDLQTAWDCWTKPEHITKWNVATEDWCCPRAENNLIPNGTFSWRMETIDGSMGFDFNGTHQIVTEGERIESTLSDRRKWKVVFKGSDEQTELLEFFQAENENPIALQRQGWQSILNNYKAYVESL